MQSVMWITTIVLLLGNLGLIVFMLRRFAAKDKAQDELSALREIIATLEKALGEEVTKLENAVRDEIRASQETTANTLSVQLNGTADTLVGVVGKLGEGQSQHLGDVIRSIETTVSTLVKTVGELGETQTEKLASVSNSVNNLTQANETRIENVRNTLDKGIQSLQTSNENKLEQIRQTVDEQLQSTLERRIGESFKLVSNRLEAVQQGLGEMKNLATGVGDLKKVLTDVRARGTWGEVQLEALLKQVLAPEQYDTNVRIKEDSREFVEFAIRLPGSDDEPGSCVWLPIDSKFTVASYERFKAADKAADPETKEQATKAFLKTVASNAKKIRDKYIAPPQTTDFAIMFLPTEGLYAEVLRQLDEVTDLQTKYRIVVAGPITLAAILSSLRLGFQTLAIQQRSSEVWEVLAAVKTEFDRFGGVMAKLKRQLKAAANTVDQTGVRTRAMERELREVEKLPPEVSAARLGLTLEEHTINGDNADE